MVTQLNTKIDIDIIEHMFKTIHNIIWPDSPGSGGGGGGGAGGAARERGRGRPRLYHVNAGSRERT